MMAMAASCPGSPSAWTVELGTQGKGELYRVTRGDRTPLRACAHPPGRHSFALGLREPGEGAVPFQVTPLVSI